MPTEKVYDSVDEYIASKLMTANDALLYSFPKHAYDMRMLMDRVLEPDAAHPLVRDLLDSIRSARFGEAQFSLKAIVRTLEIPMASLQESLSHLLFANAVHSNSPFVCFQYLLDSGFSPEPCATDLMEHIALGQYFSDRSLCLSLLEWLINKGGLILPESKAAWKALETEYPEVFAINNSRYEAQKLESYIRSQSLEVREVSRL